MTTEQRLTTRQEWAAWSDEVQADVNRVLGILSSDIEIANAVIKEKYENDPEDAGQYAADALEYLNDNWGYHEDQFMVVGEWYEPVTAYTDSGFVVEHARASAFHSVYSNGFRIKPIEDPVTGLETPVIGMSFATGQRLLEMPAVEGQVKLLAFAELGDVSLQYRRPATSDVISSSLEEIHHAITKADSLLFLHTNHEASSFYRQSAQKQQEFLRRLVNSVIDVLPLPETSDQLILHNAKTSVIYAKETGQRDVAEITPDETQKNKFRITGEVLGVTIPDVLSDGTETQYSHPDEFTASWSGLGLILDIQKANFPPLQLNDPTFVLPIRAIKKMRLSLQ